MSIDAYNTVPLWTPNATIVTEFAIQTSDGTKSAVLVSHFLQIMRSKGSISKLFSLKNTVQAIYAC